VFVDMDVPIHICGFNNARRVGLIV